jgi:ribonuclease D
LPHTLHQGDLPDGLFTGVGSVAIDSETMGLRLGRDPLCVVQICGRTATPKWSSSNRATYDAPNLKALLTNPAILKIFHFGRFDIAMFQKHLGVVTAPVYCTKIASKLARTYTDRHGLKDVTRELLGHRAFQGPAELRLGRRPTFAQNSRPMPPPTCSTCTPQSQARRDA